MSELPFGMVLNPTLDSDKQTQPGTASSSDESVRAGEPPEHADFNLRGLRARAEIEAIREVLGRTGWNRKRAAQLLKISYRGLLYKIRQHNIKRSA